ncbi:SpoVG family protein [Elusimicrobiota bacterium]
MEPTEIRIHLRNEKKLKAFVTVTLDNAFVIHNMKVIEGQKGLILCMPSRKGPDGQFRDVAHPISNEFRSLLEKKVFEAYEKEVKNLSDSVGQIQEKAKEPAAEATQKASEPAAEVTQKSS